MNKNLTIISDDLTGAVDSGSFALTSGANVRVETLYENEILPHDGNETISINMSSRTLKGKESFERHELFAKRIASIPNQLVMKKMDTGFRGNAGFEIEGLMSGLGKNICFVLDHSPSRNTFTLYGNQYVEGVILHKSIFAKEDPLKKPDSAYIPDILSRDATIPVGLINIDHVKGWNILPAVHEEIKKGTRILVFDVTGNADCANIINSIEPYFSNALWAGSTGLAWGLSNYLYGKPIDLIYKPSINLRCACFTASAYSIVRKQIATGKIFGLREIVLDIDKIIMGDHTEMDRAISKCINASKDSNFILSIHSVDNRPEGIADMILDYISTCAQEICAKINLDRVVVIGGETSYAIFSKLGITKLYLEEKPETGIGTGFIGDGPYHGKSFSIKGGSIGSEMALCRMIGLDKDVCG